VQEAAQAFPVGGSSVAAARKFATEVAERWELGNLCWPLVQIVSELASNAVIHARTDFTVRLTLLGKAAKVEVLDRSSGRAQVRSYGQDATTGRGLRLVAMLSSEWGEYTSQQGKAVWAVVRASASTEDLDSFADAFLDDGLDDLPAEAADRDPLAASDHAADLSGRAA
jgi:anti-sigma regulatory factor (Ser/Thr protein kinase)